RLSSALTSAGFDAIPAEDRDATQELVNTLRHCVVDTGSVLSEALARGERIVAEGAQGTFLDVDHRDYPYVTSTNTTVGGVFAGLGVGIRDVSKILLVGSAYLTKLGSGPFPTRVDGAIANYLQTQGNEYDTARGEMRACGWLDLMQFRRATSINSADGL